MLCFLHDIGRYTSISERKILKILHAKFTKPLLKLAITQKHHVAPTTQEKAYYRYT